MSPRRVSELSDEIEACRVEKGRLRMKLKICQDLVGNGRALQAQDLAKTAAEYGQLEARESSLELLLCELREKWVALRSTAACSTGR